MGKPKPTKQHRAAFVRPCTKGLGRWKALFGCSCFRALLLPLGMEKPSYLRLWFAGGPHPAEGVFCLPAYSSILVCVWYMHHHNCVCNWKQWWKYSGSGQEPGLAFQMMSRYLKTFCVFVLYYCGQIHYISKFRLSLDGQHSSFPSLRGFVPVPLCFSDSLDLPHYILVARRGSVKLLLSCSALHGGTALCVLPPPTFILPFVPLAWKSIPPEECRCHFKGGGRTKSTGPGRTRGSLPVSTWLLSWKVKAGGKPLWEHRLKTSSLWITSSPPTVCKAREPE